MKQLIILIHVFLASLALPFAAHAGILDYTATPLGGNTWRYDYTLTNTTPSPGFDEITIYFDPAHYSSLSAVAVPNGWDPLVIQPDTALPDDGYLDVLRLAGPVPDSAVVSGFSISVHSLDATPPAFQAFDLLNSADLSVSLSGTTTLVDASPVPEPASYALCLLGLATLDATFRRQRTRTNA